MTRVRCDALTLAALRPAQPFAAIASPVQFIVPLLALNTVTYKDGNEWCDLHLYPCSDIRATSSGQPTLEELPVTNSTQKKGHLTSDLMPSKFEVVGREGLEPPTPSV